MDAAHTQKNGLAVEGWSCPLTKPLGPQTWSDKPVISEDFELLLASLSGLFDSTIVCVLGYTVTLDPEVGLASLDLLLFSAFLIVVAVPFCERLVFSYSLLPYSKFLCISVIWRGGG